MQRRTARGRSVSVSTTVTANASAVENDNPMQGTFVYGYASRVPRNPPGRYGNSPSQMYTLLCFQRRLGRSVSLALLQCSGLGPTCSTILLTSAHSLTCHQDAKYFRCDDAVTRNAQKTSLITGVTGQHGLCRDCAQRERSNRGPRRRVRRLRWRRAPTFSQRLRIVTRVRAASMPPAHPSNKGAPRREPLPPAVGGQPDSPPVSQSQPP